MRRFRRSGVVSVGSGQRAWCAGVGIGVACALLASSAARRRTAQRGTHPALTVSTLDILAALPAAVQLTAGRPFLDSRMGMGVS